MGDPFFEPDFRCEFGKRVIFLAAFSQILTVPY